MERSLAKEDQPVQTRLLDGPDEAFGEGFQVSVTSADA